MADSRNIVLVLEDNEHRVELMREALAYLPVRLELLNVDNAWALSKNLAKLLPSACLISLDHDLSDSRTGRLFETTVST